MNNTVFFKFINTKLFAIFISFPFRSKRDRQKTAGKGFIFFDNKIKTIGEGGWLAIYQ